jgi:hypothetical protein
MGPAKRPPARPDECRPRKCASHAQLIPVGPERDSISPSLAQAVPGRPECTKLKGQPHLFASSSGSSSSSDVLLAFRAENAEARIIGCVERLGDRGPEAGPSGAQPCTEQELETEPLAAVQQDNSRKRKDRRVTFAQGPIASSPDGHPDRSVPSVACPRRVPTFVSTQQPVAETLSRASILAMEDELGQEFQQANSSSLVRLKRRVRSQFSPSGALLCLSLHAVL